MRIRLAAPGDAEAIRAIYNHEVTSGATTFDLVPRTAAEQLAWLDRHQGAHPAVVAVLTGPPGAPTPGSSAAWGPNPTPAVVPGPGESTAGAGLGVPASGGARVGVPGPGESTAGAGLGVPASGGARVGVPGRAESTVLGFGALSPFRSRAAYATTVEDSLYVDRAHRGGGVGRAVLEELVRLAAGHGFHTIVARIVGHNEASIGLHRTCGFELVGVEREVGRKHGRWLDVVELQLVV